MTTPKKSVAKAAPAKKVVPPPKKTTSQAVKATAKKAGAKTKNKSFTVMRTVTGTTNSTDSSFSKRYAPQYRAPRSVVTSRHILAAEFFLGMTIILVNPSKDIKTGGADVTDTLGQAAAFLIVWIVLFGVTSGGDSAASVASNLGGLIVLTLLLYTSSDNIITRIASFFGGAVEKKQPAAAAPFTGDASVGFPYLPPTGSASADQ